jgi:hypothetical protein
MKLLSQGIQQGFGQLLNEDMRYRVFAQQKRGHKTHRSGIDNDDLIEFVRL